VNLIHGRSFADIVRSLHVGRLTVYDVAKRFRECGEVGRIDRREENEDRKLDKVYLANPDEAVAASSQAYDWQRPTWTRNLPAETTAWETGVRIHTSTMSTALKRFPQGRRVRSQQLATHGQNI